MKDITKVFQELELVARKWQGDQKNPTEVSMHAAADNVSR